MNLWIVTGVCRQPLRFKTRSRLPPGGIRRKSSETLRVPFVMRDGHVCKEERACPLAGTVLLKGRPPCDVTGNRAASYARSPATKD